jgi:hypothetical protein
VANGTLFKSCPKIIIAKFPEWNSMYKGGTVMETIIKFKNRETTARHGRLPNEILIFADISMPKDELDLIYESIRHEIGRCAKKEYYNVIKVYINLMLDIEDIFREIKSKYKNVDDYLFQMPLHVLELGYLLKSLKDYGGNLDKVPEENNETLYKLNLLVEEISLLIKNNYKALKRLYTIYDKTQRLALVKEIWNNMYELTMEG